MTPDEDQTKTKRDRMRRCCMSCGLLRRPVHWGYFDAALVRCSPSSTERFVARRSLTHQQASSELMMDAGITDIFNAIHPEDRKRASPNDGRSRSQGARPGDGWRCRIFR